MKKKRKSVKEFSKQLVLCVLFVSIVFLGMCIVMDRAEIGVAITSEIIAVSLGYFLKAFYGKRNEEEMAYRRDRFINKEDEDV